MRRRIAFVSLVAALVVPAAGSAEDSSASDPQAAAAGYYTIEVGETQLAGGEAARLSRGRAFKARALAAASGCKRVWAARVYRNIFGVVLWKYFQQQAFCYSGTRITSLYDWRRWPEIYAPGWSFKGHIGRSTRGGAGTWFYGTWTQGKFALCAAYCIAERHPWVDLVVRGNGSWTYATGGT